jgi:hypothetical protein
VGLAEPPNLALQRTRPPLRFLLRVQVFVAAVSAELCC